MNFEDKIRQRYTGESGKKYHGALRQIPESAYPWISKLRMKKMSRNIERNDIVAEYGVGFGWNLSSLKCKKRIGFDVAEHLEPVVRSHNIEFVKDTKAIPDGYADVVICHHVLEHVATPPEVLEEIKRILCRKGKLLLFVPYEKEQRYRHYNPGEPNHHIYSWNVQTLGNLVSDIGFRIVTGNMLKFGYDRFAACWAERFHLGEIGFHLIRNSVHLIKPALEVHIVATKE